MEELWVCQSFWKCFFLEKLVLSDFLLLAEFCFLVYSCWRIASLKTVFFTKISADTVIQKGLQDVSVDVSVDVLWWVKPCCMWNLYSIWKCYTALGPLWSTFSFIFRRFVFICFLSIYSLFSLVLRLKIAADPDIHLSFFQDIYGTWQLFWENSKLLHGFLQEET